MKSELHVTYHNKSYPYHFRQTSMGIEESFFKFDNIYTYAQTQTIQIKFIHKHNIYNNFIIPLINPT